MFSKQQDPEEIKKLVTSILISTTSMMTVEMLQKDFKNMMGDDIPYIRMGFKSLEHYLSSIPDTVRVRVWYWISVVLARMFCIVTLGYWTWIWRRSTAGY